MLAILRTLPADSPVTTALDASVTLRDKDGSVEGKPDISFSIKTYMKISETKKSQDRDDKDDVDASDADDGDSSTTGDQILLPINLFFDTLNQVEQNALYDMYRFAATTIRAMNKDNRRELQDGLQEKIFNTISRHNLVSKLIAFCQTPQFVYPDLRLAGTEAHHSPDKTFLLQDYVEITAISLLSKLMVPIWGEFIGKLRALAVDQNKIEKIAFDLIEPTLEESAFERINMKLFASLSNLVKEKRTSGDKKSMTSGVMSSYILTHNAIDDDMFNAIVMATIIVKRMATYECFGLQKGSNSVPNAMVYIDDGIKRTTETKIGSMRTPMKTMPRKELPQHDTEDNSSILDHASRTSKKPIDVPVLTVTAVEEWEIPRILMELDIPVEAYHEALIYYRSNSFDFSPLCQAMVASFIGTRFGGSKPLSYLPPLVYQKLVVILQIFLIRNDLLDLATMISSTTSLDPVENAHGSMSTRIDGKLRSDEYKQCLELFKGWVKKPVIPFGKRVKTRNPDMETLDFVHVVAKMKEWIVRHTHGENMAPSLWALAGRPHYPVAGSEVHFDDNIITKFCRFVLMFHGTKRPF